MPGAKHNVQGYTLQVVAVTNIPPPSNTQNIHCHKGAHSGRCVVHCDFSLHPTTFLLLLLLQTEDQSFETRDNAALVESVKTGTPVRVFRGKQANKDGKPERKYVYEGLYKATEYKMEPSKDGPLVCRYKMEAIPGHSAVTGKVDYKIFGKNPFRVRDLANTAARKRSGSKRAR